MSRISNTLARLQAAGRKALIPYVTAGFPDPEATLPVLHAMVAAGADAIELGVPFSDPMADGPVIQHANEVALAHRVGLRAALEMLREFRAQDARTPVVLMGYANPIERMGVERFLDEAGAAGVDGLIVVDYPPEESKVFAARAREHGIDPIFLLAPTSDDARIAMVAEQARGYVYYVSLKGTTGAGHIDTEEVARKVSHIKRATSLPVGVGFGIRDGATARAVAREADAVIIGSRTIQVLEEGPREGAVARVSAFIADIRRALDETQGQGGGTPARSGGAS